MRGRSRGSIDIGDGWHWARAASRSRSPHVTLSSGPTSYVVITEMRPNGFKWKNGAAKEKEFFANGEVTWVSKGVLETAPATTR